MFRTVGDAADVRRAIAPLERRVRDRARARGAAGAADDRARLRHGGVSLHDRHSVPERWGEPLLFGPGSIHVAHTADEFVSIAELNAAVGHYVDDRAKRCCTRSGVSDRD